MCLCDCLLANQHTATLGEGGKEKEEHHNVDNSNSKVIRVRGCAEQTESESEVQVRHFGTPWTAVYQAPPFMGFSRQEYWSGLPFPSPEDLPDPGIELRSPAL